MADDDQWSDVIDQVLSALGDANIKDGPTRETLAAGVREALESLQDGVGIDVEILGSELFDMGAGVDSATNIEVVPGGRESDEPKSEGVKPELRIAEPDDTAVTETESAGVSDSGPILTHVKVLHSGARSAGVQGKKIPGLSDAGWIHVAPGGAAQSEWQTVYRGLSPRLYRIACAQGCLDVTVDGESVERLVAGQSIDVEGAAIRVTSTEEGGAKGGYSLVVTGSFHGEEE
jgi:hypothetical protein